MSDELRRLQHQCEMESLAKFWADGWLWGWQWATKGGSELDLLAPRDAARAKAVVAGYQAGREALSKARARATEYAREAVGVAWP